MKALIVSGLLLALIAFVCGYQRGARAKAQITSQQAETFKRSADAQVETARRADQGAETATKKTAQAHIRTENARQMLQNQALQKPPVDVAPQECPPLVVATVLDDPEGVLITAQDEEIRALRFELTLTQQARDSWKLAFDNERKRSACMEMAFEARLAAERAGKWKWGIIGFGAGAGVGYVGGRLR